MINSMYRKRHQRMVNKVFREANRIVENDDLWLGRFVVKQKASWFYDFFNDGEPYLLVEYYFYDKKTKTQSRSHFARDFDIFLLSHLMYGMNEFIIHEVKVWENENPRTDERVDYRARD